MLWLALMVALGQDAVPARRLVPFQADVSGVGAFGARSAAGIALYVGAAVGVARSPWGTPFGGAGFELVYQLTPDPYRVSYGAQLRAGYAWGAASESLDVPPNLLVYGRLTPFFSTTAITFANEASAERALNSFGLRAGLGVTVPAWTKLLLFGGVLPEVYGFAGETMRVLASLLLAPLAILNHAELTLEVLAARQPLWTFTFRLGSGF